jgi:hypothetical protein
MHFRRLAIRSIAECPPRRREVIVSRFQRYRFTCRRLLTTMLVSIGLVMAAATPSNAVAEPAQSSLPALCSPLEVRNPWLTATRFGDVVSVSARVWCNVSYSMSIDLTLVFPGGETTQHFEKTQPDQTEVTGTVSRLCTGPGWYLGRAHFILSTPGPSLDTTFDSQWVWFWCGVIRFP